MSNDKEFDKAADYDRLLLANVKLHNKINSQQKTIDKKDEEIERLKKENNSLKSALSITLSHYIEFPEDEEDDLFIAHCRSLLKKSSEVEDE